MNKSKISLFHSNNYIDINKILSTIKDFYLVIYKKIFTTFLDIFLGPDLI